MDRDRGLAEALEVEPLDDLTRRRLVRRALDATRPVEAGLPRPRGRTIAAVGVAASLLVGVTVGALVVTRPEQPATPTAAGSEQTAATSASDAAPEAAVTPASPQPLGDLGAVTDVVALAAAVDLRLQAGHRGEDATALVAPCVDADAGALVLVSATGTATLAGRPVVVHVGPTASGEIRVVALDAGTCAELSSTRLPSA